MPNRRTPALPAAPPTCLGEGPGASQLAEAEVLVRIVGIAQRKTPAEVQQQPLARRTCPVDRIRRRADLRKCSRRARQPRLARLGPQLPSPPHPPPRRP